MQVRRALAGAWASVAALLCHASPALAKKCFALLRARWLSWPRRRRAALVPVVLGVVAGVGVKLATRPRPEARTVPVAAASPAPLEISLRAQQVARIDLGDRPRGVSEGAAIPGDARPEGEEPPVFVPSSVSADHNETANLEARSTQGDSLDFTSATPDASSPAERARGRSPGVNDSIGVGGGSSGSHEPLGVGTGSGARYGSRNGGRAAPAPLIGRTNSSAGGGSAGGGSAGSVEAARTLATADELRPHAPELLVRMDSQLVPVPLSALRLSAVLAATRARILVDATFAVPPTAAREGTFAVALPEGASPVYLGTFQFQGAVVGGVDANTLLDRETDPSALLAGGEFLTQALQPSGKEAGSVAWGELRPARVVEQARGKEVYEATTRRRVDPALMEWSGSNKFTTRVFPLAPNGHKRILFAYDVTPREHAGSATVSLPVPAKPPAAFRLELSADARAYANAKLVGAPPTAFESEGDFLRGEATSVGEGAVVLAGTPRASLVRGGVSHRPGLPGSLVHARLFPAVATSATRPTGDAIFVLDTSLSQRTRLAASCGKVLRSVLERDSTIARFRVLAFDVKARELTKGWQKASPAARDEALASVAAQTLEGATSLESALDSLEELVAPGEHPTLFLLSDAQVTWGVEDPRELERAHPRLFAERWVAYQLGDAPVNRTLLDRLTRAGGRIVPVAPGALEACGTAHATAALALDDVRVEGVAASDLVVAGSPRALYPEQEVEVAFRLPEGQDARAATVVLATRAGELRFPLAHATLEDALAARAWAELTANRLLEQEDAKADAVALALSQRFFLANRVASFLILETDAEYVQHALEPAALDLAALVKASSGRDARPAGAPDLAAFEPRVRAFLADIRRERAEPWPRPAAKPGTSAVWRHQPWPERLEPQAVLSEAVSCAEAGRAEDALRVLSSLVEESPRDAQMLRLAGYQLLSWGLAGDAATLFARTRTLRTFEPQAWLAEAVALEADGQVGEAAVRYEHVLAKPFDARFDGWCKTTARRLYARLLRGLGKLGAARWAEVAEDRSPPPAFEAVVLWNQDDTDVDLHVLERGSGEVYFRRLQSQTGGHLHWDNTVGLGPELYTHPTQEPAEIFVHYYGSRSVAGTVPAATLLLTFEKGEPVSASCALLEHAGKKSVLFRGAPSR